MVSSAAVPARGQKILYNQTYQDEDDPFLFDEQRLRYDGYDNHLVARPSKRHAPHHLPLSGISSEHRTRSYTLPVPPASIRPRLVDDETPVKEYRGAHMPKSTKFDSSSSSTQVPIPRLQRHHLPHATAATLSKNTALIHGQPQQTFENTISPFFGNDTVLHQPRNFTNTSGMPVLGGINLVSIHGLPDRLRPLFLYPAFNRMQSKCFKAAYGCDDNLVVSAPTASGKTTIFELAICRLITRMDITNIKMVYIGPTKALCEERSEDWSQRFRHLGVTCSLLTGDSDNSQQQIIKRSQLIVTTPEKWDSITRTWQDKDKLMHLVRLLLIDEVHTLNEERGASLEAVVTRMKSTGKSVRLIALSATVPNATDVAAWIGRNSNEPVLPAHLEVFGEEFRPCKLQKVVHPCKHAENMFKLDHNFNSELPHIIQKYSISKAIMVFCPTRNSARSTAVFLAKAWNNASRKLWPAPQKVPRVQEEDLKDMLSAGVAYHHAGLIADDRKIIQQAYLDGNLMVICCTSTLSVGVNLPCHLVIIKNTLKWVGGVSVDYSDLDILQMLGRAGRPQFGDHGIGVIMTTPNKVARYQSLAEGKDLLESYLHLNLIEHLNAEITLGTIHSLQDAKTWLASTFLFVRLQKNQEHYFPGGLSQGVNLDQQLERICAVSISELRKHDMIETVAYRATEFGELMTRQYVRFKTMVTIIGMNYAAKTEHILAMLCSLEELRDIKLDFGTAELRAMIKTDFKKYESYTEDTHALGVTTILHFALSRLKPPSNPKKEFPVGKYRFRVSGAISKLIPLVNSVVECRRILKDGISVGNALELSRSLAAQAWDNSPSVLVQLKDIGDKRLDKIKMLGIKSFDDLINTEAELLDRCGNTSLFGTKLLSAAKEVPALRITASVVRKELGHGSPRVHCRVELGFFNTTTPKTFNKEKVSLHLLIVRSDGYLVVYKHVQAIERQSELIRFFSVDLEEHGQRIICQVSCDRIAGTKQEAVIDPDIPAHQFVSLKKPEPVQPSIQLAPIARTTSLALNEDIEFDDDNLNAEDFLAAESEGFQPASSLYAVLKDSIAKSSNKQTAECKTNRSMPQSGTRTMGNPAKPTAAKSRNNNGEKEPCQRSCKDKSSCGDGCSQNGRKRTRTKKDPVFGGTSRNAKEKAKKSTVKTSKTSKQQQLHTSQAKISSAKVTKASSQGKQSVSVLDKIYKSAKGSTLPVALLARNPVTVGNQSTAPQVAIVHSSDDLREIDEGWFNDTTDHNDGAVQLQVTADAPLHHESGPSQIQDHKYKRRSRQWIPDILTDSELDDYEPKNPVIQASSKSLGKRKADPSLHGPSKKIRTDNCTDDMGDFGISSPPSLHAIPEGRNGRIVTSGDSVKAAIAAPEVEKDQFAQMSQEMASYQPFGNIPGIDPDFIAQYEGCCEFVE